MSKKKPYTIESMYIGTASHSMFNFLYEWSKWNAYETEKDRDKALDALNRKGTRSAMKMEYRKGR